METLTFARLRWVPGPEGKDIPNPVDSEEKRAFCRGRKICYLCGNICGDVYDFFNWMHRCRDHDACDERYSGLTEHPVTVQLFDDGFRIVDSPFAA